MPCPGGPSLARASPAMPTREEEPRDQQLLVVLRIRPLSDAELEEGATTTAHKMGDQMVVLMDPGEDPEDTMRTHRSREKTFIFDAVFDQHASQEDVYRATTQHLVEGVVSGYNATVFAYGPSGAGKTYSMLGMDAEPGIYLQALRDLFRAIEDTRDNMDYSVSMSYLEIYNEMIRDLLNPSSGFLELREDARGSIQIAGITEVSTSNAQEIMQLLTKGNRQRTQEPTAANTTSSRSHAVLQVTVRQRCRGTHLAEEVRVGRLFLVDLAGSERASQTQNRGKRMKEGAHINRSLLALGNCINALSEKGGGRAQYVNFRDSKLTRLLKDALGGNSQTVMIAHISPASTHFEESRNTLLYAYRAKNIKTRVKRNLLSVSYHIAQYTDVISDLRREIEHLKSKIEKQAKEKSNPSVRDVPVPVSPLDGEDSHLQMSKIRAQLIGAFKEQLEMRRSLVELENGHIELHVDMSRHLLTIADWERERSHQEPRDPTSMKDEELAEADGDGDGEEGAEPPEVALAREEVNILLAEQRKNAALKAGLEQRLAHAKRKASQLERLLPGQSVSAEQREVLQLLCRVHELEVGSTELQAHSLRRKNLLCQKDFVIQRYHQHRLLCEQLIQDQQQLIHEAGIPVPEDLQQRFRLYSRELGEGSLNRLLLLHSVMSSSLRVATPFSHFLDGRWREDGPSPNPACAQDGSVLCVSPAPEEATREPQANRKDLPWGAQFELPPILLETDSDGHRSAKGTPSKSLGKADALLPPTSVRILLTPPSHEKPSPLSVKNLVSKLYPPANLDLGPTNSTGGEALSPQTLREMAEGTKGITLIAASRRAKAQDRDGGSDRSSLHLPDDVTLDSRDPSPADRRWRQTSPSRDRSLERKARKKRSPSLTRGTVHEPPTESQPSVPLQLSKSPGKSFFPAVPTAAKIKPSLSSHSDEHSLSFTFPSAVWQSTSAPSRGPLLPRDVRGSMNTGSHRHSPLPPSDPRRPPGGSAKRPRRPR